MRRVVVTGANRGLGLEFCTQFLEKGDCVVAVIRNAAAGPGLARLKELWPETLHFRTLDVTDAVEVTRFGLEMEQLPVDILINNAGQIGPEKHNGEEGQAADSLSFTVLRELFEVNALAPLRLTMALVPALLRAPQPKVFVMGSTVGVAAETFGDYYGYRMSKSAAHIAFASLAKDLRERGILVGVLCPGWVRTDLGGPNAPLSPRDSVLGMIDVIDRFSLSENGKFVSYDGRLLEY